MLVDYLDSPVITSPSECFICNLFSRPPVVGGELVMCGKETGQGVPQWGQGGEASRKLNISLQIIRNVK